MVLYTNDAVEVRFSDNSRLHILPCGTSFTYHTAQDGHPVHGKLDRVINFVLSIPGFCLFKRGVTVCNCTFVLATLGMPAYKGIGNYE